MGHVVTFKTLIKPAFIPWKCLTMKRVQLPLLPQVMEVSESKYSGIFCFAGPVLNHTEQHCECGHCLFSFSSLLPLPSLELLCYMCRHYTLTEGRRYGRVCLYPRLKPWAIFIKSSTVQLQYHFCYYFRNTVFTKSGHGTAWSLKRLRQRWFVIAAPVSALK